MSKWILAVMLVGSLAGCATSPPVASSVTPGKAIANKFQAKGENTGTYIVTRDSGVLGIACLFGAYIDGVQIGELEHAQSLTVYLPPGEHIAGVKARMCSGDDEKSFTIQVGETKRFRVAPTYAGPKIEPTAF